MNVLDPANTEHIIKVIPRYYPEGDITLYLYNEASKEEQSLTITPVLSNGYLYATFAKTFTDNSTYQLRIEQEGDIVYRGKVFVTGQANDTQAYKISKDIFTL